MRTFGFYLRAHSHNHDTRNTRLRYVVVIILPMQIPEYKYFVFRFLGIRAAGTYLRWAVYRGDYITHANSRI